MRILVTGAGGFLGARTAERLSGAGHVVRVTARRPLHIERNARTLQYVQADLAEDDLHPLVAEVDAIVHCAARASPWGPRERFVRDNVVTTQRLRDAAIAAGTVRRFVHISSSSIYFKYRDALDIDEQFEPPARWPTAYAETKWLSEQVVLPERRIGTIVLRPRAVIGSGDRAIVPRIMTVARRGYFPLPGGGRSLIDVTCVDNLVDAIELALGAPPAAEGKAFNITNGEPMPMRQLLEKLFDSLDLKVRLISLPRSLATAIATCAETLAHLRRDESEPRITRYGMGLLCWSQTLCIEAARHSLRYQPRLNTDQGLRAYSTRNPSP